MHPVAPGEHLFKFDVAAGHTQSAPSMCRGSDRFETPSPSTLDDTAKPLLREALSHEYAVGIVGGLNLPLRAVTNFVMRDSSLTMTRFETDKLLALLAETDKAKPFLRSAELDRGKSTLRPFLLEGPTWAQLLLPSEQGSVGVCPPHGKPSDAVYFHNQAWVVMAAGGRIKQMTHWQGVGRCPLAQAVTSAVRICERLPPHTGPLPSKRLSHTVGGRGRRERGADRKRRAEGASRLSCTEQRAKCAPASTPSHLSPCTQIGDRPCACPRRHHAASQLAGR